MTTPLTPSQQRIEAIVDVDALLDELPPEEYSRTEVLTVLEYMIERQVEINPTTVAHALEAREIEYRLRKVGIVTRNDGRSDQVTATKNLRGRVMLTFKQVDRLLREIEANQ